MSASPETRTSPQNPQNLHLAAERMNRRRAHRDRGVVLVVALVSLVVVAGLMVTMLGAVNAEKDGVSLQGDRAQAMKLAEGALQVAEDQLITNTANFVPVATPPNNAPFQVLAGTYTLAGKDATWTIERSTNSSSGTPVAIPPFNRTDAPTGLRQTIEPYVITSTVRVGMSATSMRKHIEMIKVPIFQFLAYYGDDLEIQPGPAMTLAGRIHTNSNLHLGPGTSLTCNSPYVRAAGNLIHHRKDDSSTPAGWIKIRDLTSPAGALVTLPSRADLLGLGITSLYGLDSSFTGWDINGDSRFTLPGEMAPFRDRATELFHGTLQTGEHGVRPLAAPNVGSIQPYEAMPGGTGGDYVAGNTAGTFVSVAAGTGTHRKGYYHRNADLVVINDKVYNKAGTDITSQMPSGFVTVRTIWDQREGRYNNVSVINVGKLGDMDGNANTLDRCTKFPANGLIYATRTDGVVGTPNGIVITNGATVNTPPKWNTANYGGGRMFTGSPPTGAYAFTNADVMGVSVVTPCPIYVHGDFNTVGTKPCSVITDALNLLSNAWDYTKGPNQSKTATNTTYNMAIICGNDNTTVGHYNGGFENLPRFHENWSSKTATINGSFVNLWRSTHARGAWVYGGSYYDAPTRNWSFDSTYDAGSLPPFTPMVVSTRAMAWQVTN